METLTSGFGRETAIAALLVEFAARQRSSLSGLGDDLDPFIDEATAFVAGGKRVRPLFCLGGWIAGGGDPDSVEALSAAASLEWLQGSALVHDDLMDGSQTRRGRPAAHRHFAALHRDHRWPRSAEKFGAEEFGAGAAILLGDLMLSWCDDMFRSSGIDPASLHRAGPFLDLAKSEVVGGQFLDLVAQARGNNSIDDAMRVVRFKSAKYTVERPLHLGAALAGADRRLLDRLSAFGLPLGEAFQLRDDLLGVFGDPAATGKPAGDDIREGKRTVLVARAAEAASPADRALLERALGDQGLSDADLDLVRTVITASGAHEAVESQIHALERDAESALTEIGDAGARSYLSAMLDALTGRTS